MWLLFDLRQTKKIKRNTVHHPDKEPRSTTRILQYYIKCSLGSPLPVWHNVPYWQAFCRWLTFFLFLFFFLLFLLDNFLNRMIFLHNNGRRRGRRRWWRRRRQILVVRLHLGHVDIFHLLLVLPLWNWDFLKVLFGTENICDIHRSSIFIFSTLSYRLLRSLSLSVLSLHPIVSPPKFFTGMNRSSSYKLQITHQKLKMTYHLLLHLSPTFILIWGAPGSQGAAHVFQSL